MTAMAAEFSEIIETLTEEDLRSALDYVRFLSASRKKAAKATMKQIQGILPTTRAGRTSRRSLLTWPTSDGPEPLDENPA